MSYSRTRVHLGQFHSLVATALELESLRLNALRRNDYSPVEPPKPELTDADVVAIQAAEKKRRRRQEKRKGIIYLTPFVQQIKEK